MYANRPALDSVKTLSMSTEHLTQEQALISIPPPMSNLPYDPPHLSRWQQATQRQQVNNTTRSGSAVAQRNDLERQRNASKAGPLNDQFRALTLHSRNHCDPLCQANSRPSILNAKGYELSDDLRAREICLMERYYGGRTKAHRAARIIQAKYREYRMRAQYARLRTDRRAISRRVAESEDIYANDDQLADAHHLASMEDLVINRAYQDWGSDDTGSGGEGSLPDLTGEAKGSRSSAPYATSVQQHPAEAEHSSQSCSNLAAPNAAQGQQRQQSSPGTGTGSTSGFASSPGSCSSGSLATENPQANYCPEPPKRQHTEPPRPQQNNQQQQQQPVLYYLVDGRNESQRTPQPQQQLYVAVPMKPGQQYVKIVPDLQAQQQQVQQLQHQQSQRYLTSTPSASTVLVRRSSTGSNSRQPPIWCTPDGKMYTLAYTSTGDKPVAIAMQPNQSPHQPHLLPQQQPAVFVTPVKKEVIGNGPVLVKLQHQTSSTVFNQQSQRPGAPAPITLAERLRKRLYRVCLNYFNKSPVKGIDMLIKFRFLDPSPRQIARFLLTRKGLSRSAIGEFLGDIKHDLPLATSRQFIRELNFKDKDVDEALRILMSRFRTPGESQKIVHLLTEFQTAYIGQNPARVNAQFRNTDTVMILSYAIIMLHTDMYSPNVRPSQKMTREGFVKNLRGVDDDHDLDRNLLLAIYERIQAQEITVAPDHTDQVRKIDGLLTGPLKPTNLILSQRRLVCYCRLYEVVDRNKKERPGAHQREIFLFNDLLLITKANTKRRKDDSPSYQVRSCINLFGVRVSNFETPYYPNGVSLHRVDHTDPKEKQSRSSHGQKSTSSELNNDTHIISLNAKTNVDQLRLIEDIQECILETAEMDRVRLDDVLCKQASIQTVQMQPAAVELRHQTSVASVSSMNYAPQTKRREMVHHHHQQQPLRKCIPDQSLSSQRVTAMCVPAVGLNCHHSHNHQQHQYPSSVGQRTAYVLKTPNQSG